MKLTFRQIEVFQAVITAGSLSEAAQFLGVSQPAVSRLVADFEAQVGFLLFQKSGRTLQATPEAWLLLEEVRRAYSGLNRVREAATAIRDFRDGKLDLIATPAAVRQMAPELIKCFSDKYPKIAVSLEVQGVDRTLDSAAGGGHDFAMTGGHLADGSLECLTLAVTEAVCLVPETHPLACRSVICPQDLEGEPFVSYRADAGQRNRIDAVFAAANIKRSMQFEARTTDAIYRMVGLGLGVSIVGWTGIDRQIMSGTRAVPFEPRLLYQLNMLWTPHKPMTAAATAFLAMVKDEMAKKSSNCCPRKPAIS